MRDPRGVDHCITASYDMPAVIKDSTKVDGEAKNDIKISYDTNNSANVESVSEHKEIILVATGETMPSETTIDLDLDENENDNESKVRDINSNAKVLNAQIDGVERHKKLNGADDGPSKVKSDDKFNADVSSQSEHTNKILSELVNGIECNLDGDVNDLNSNRTRLSTESHAANDNGTVERNEQRSNKATTTATKSNKRKISISSEDEQLPPAKK